MNRRNTPMYLSIISDKITDATNIYNPKNEYAPLCALLKEIQNKIEPFVFLERHSLDNVDWHKTVPIMSDLISELEANKLGNTLHTWHYVDNNDSTQLELLKQQVGQFLLFLDSLLDE